MKHNYVTKYVYTKFEHVLLFVQKAWTYRNDWQFIDPQKIMTFDEVIESMISKYKLVQGEQIIRPIHFNKVSGDCDNQLVYLLSFIFYRDQNQILNNDLRFIQSLIIVRDYSIHGNAHIMLGQLFNDGKIILFDGLPKKFQYDNDQIKKREYDFLTEYMQKIK